MVGFSFGGGFLLSRSSVAEVQECKEGLLSPGSVESSTLSGQTVILCGKRRSVLVGGGTLVKVNTSIGCSRKRHLAAELEKIDKLSTVGYKPDIMMDLSIVRVPVQPFEHMVDEFGGPVGTLPHYLCYQPRRGIDKTQLLEEIERQASSGIAWMTLHLTASIELYELASQTRGTPLTARGGGLIVEDMVLNNRSNVLVEILPEILRIFARYGTALSLGTTFRPANTVDALDEVHRREICGQRIFRDEARQQGVKVMLEAVGHMRLADCHTFTSFVKSNLGSPMPIMTLGPIPTDAAVGEDHIASAIGGAYLAMLGGTHVLNSVTREEHTGGIPVLGSILEGLKAARIAAHSVNISQFPKLDRIADVDGVKQRRDRNYTCVVGGGLFSESSVGRVSMGCSRCGNQCPLILNSRLGG